MAVACDALPSPYGISRGHKMAYYDKETEILNIARGQRVLHLGCVGDDVPNVDWRQRAEQSLHAPLSQVADVVGVDLNERAVREYRRLGIFQNIVVGNVEQLDELPIEGPFDVVVAGDIIEHVSNPGRMLEGIKRFCRPDTRVVLTTPHAFGLPNFLRFLLGVYRESNEHVMTFNVPQMRQLLERHGYRLQEMSTCHQPRRSAHGILFRLGRAFLRRFSRFGGTLFIVAKPDWRQPTTVS
jgi:SAM-dependent methyltransferase